jgi:hypothetical protein
MTNMAVNQRRWLLRMQSGDPEIPTQRPVEIPDPNPPAELQPQHRPQEAPQSPQTPEIQPSQTPPEVSPIRRSSHKTG